MSKKLLTYFTIALVVLLVLIALPLWGSEPAPAAGFDEWRAYQEQSRFDRNPVGVLATLLAPVAALGALISGAIYMVKGRRSPVAL